MAEFGTPETWNMKVGDFIESDLPKEKPQALLDLQEQNRKQRLLDALKKIGPGLMDESIQFIQRENFGVKGTSKILPKLNAEAQEEFGKDWDKLNADNKRKISSRVRAREVSALKKVDPAKNQNILRQKATEKRIKNFAAKFKEEKGRVPMIKEIKDGVKTGHREITKYLKKSEYATPKQAFKFKKQVEVRDIPDEMKSWFKENYPGKDWKKDLTIAERGLAKEAFEKRNNPAVLNRKEFQKLDDYLSLQKEKGVVLLEGSLEDIAKSADADLSALQTRNYISNNFPDTFNYKGNRIENIPKIRNRIAELAKTLPDREIFDKLVEEKLLFPQRTKRPDYKIVKKILKSLKKEGKIDEILKNPKSELTLEQQIFRDNLVKEYINKNPDVDNASQIAKGIVRENPELKMSSNYVKKSVERQGLEKTFTSRHAKIFPDIQALDKIIKDLPELKSGEELPKNFKEKVLVKYANATGKSIAKAEGELVSRMRKLGTLYTGDVGRYEVDLYKKIKPPKNYVDSNFHKNFINLTDRTGEVSNIDMAKLLGLSKSEQKLIQGTANMFSVFDFNVAGDHTDIKSMMRDFPKYKKNFSRIEYIKDTLNDFKQTYDTKINAKRKAAQQVTGKAQQILLEEAQDIADEFARKTGYRIGMFGLDKGRVTINPQTLRLPDLKNPYNETLQQAMENFEQTKNPKLGGKAATKPEKFTGLDKRLMEADASERAKIFKDVAGTPEAKESLYMRALQKIPKIGPLATKIIAGTAGAAAYATLAQASDNEDFISTEDVDGNLMAMELPKTDAETLDEFAEEETSLAGDIGAGAGLATGATLASKLTDADPLKGARRLGKQGAKNLLKTIFKIGASPTAAAGFAGSELAQGNIKTAGASLLAPEIVGTLASKGGQGILSRAGSILLNPFGKAARAFTPLGLATIGAGMGKDVYDEYKRREALTDEERLAEDLEAQEKFDEVMIGAAEGGRIGFADGPDDPSKRKFMKLMGILSLLPYGLGKFAKPAAKVAPVAAEGVKLGFDKFMMLVNKIKELGTPTSKVTQKEREVGYTYTGKDGSEYELVEDLTTGDIRVTKDKPGFTMSGDEAFDTIEDRSTFVLKKGQADETTKGKKPPDEYDEVKEVASPDGTFDDVDEISDEAVKEVLDEID